MPSDRNGDEAIPETDRNMERYCLIIIYTNEAELGRVLPVRENLSLLKKKAQGVLGLRGVTAQGVLWQHTRVLS